MFFDCLSTFSSPSTGIAAETLRELEQKKTAAAAERVKLREESQRLIVEAQRLDEVLQDERLGSNAAAACQAQQQVAELLEKRRVTVTKDRSLSLILLDIEQQISDGYKDLGSDEQLSIASTPPSRSRLEQLQAEAMNAISLLQQGTPSPAVPRKVSFLDS